MAEERDNSNTLFEEASSVDKAEKYVPSDDVDVKKVHWDFLTDSRELTIQEDEVVITCGIRFSPSGAKFTEPIKVTLDHNAKFTNPRHAEIVFYTRNKDSKTFERIPASTGGYPRCHVRAMDLDIYVDHFSDYWIVAIMQRAFMGQRPNFEGKKVNCAPYVRTPVRKWNTNLVLLCIYDDLVKVIKKVKQEMAMYRQLHPSELMLVDRNGGDININLFEGLKTSTERIDEEKLRKTDFNHVYRKQFSFKVTPLESGKSQKFLTFTLDQEESLISPTRIQFEFPYDAKTTDVATTAAESLCTMHTNFEAALSGEEGEKKVEPDEKGYYTQLMKPANPTQEQLDQEKNYKMDILPKGQMFMMNISKYREGSEVDVRNIEHVFKEIGFEIKSSLDLTAKELIDELEKFVNSPCHEGMCSSVFLFMGHGSKRGISCDDGEVVTTEFIRDKVSGMKYMNGKPKLIFFQCCRGDVDVERVERDQLETDLTIPAKSDVLMVHATTDGNVSYRSPVRGSWFIQMLCEELLTNAHVSDLSTMLDQVTGKVRNKTFKENLKSYGQCPVVVKQGISKKIYFLPKYPPAENE